MGDSSDRKRSKKSKRSKRAKKHQVSKDARRSVPGPHEDGQAVGDGLSAASQAVVIELQRTELSRLLREQRNLNKRVDQLLQLHEREQVLRQQMQAALDNLAAQRALPPPPENQVEQQRLVARVNRAEGKFAALQAAVGRLVAVLERQTASAQ